MAHLGRATFRSRFSGLRPAVSTDFAQNTAQAYSLYSPPGVRPQQRPTVAACASQPKRLQRWGDVTTLPTMDR